MNTANRIHTAGIVMQRSTIVAVVTTFVYLLYRLSCDIYAGGNSWKQGDWLINSAAGYVRRSLTGDIAVFISEVTGVNPLLIIGILQAALLFALFIVLYRVFRSISDDLAFIVISSPAFFPAFWTTDPQGSLRKELIVFLAILLLVDSVSKRSKTQYWASVGIYAMACFSHEALVLFSPLMLFIGYWLSDRVFSLQNRFAFAFTVLFASFSAAIYGINFANGPGSDAVCAVIVQLGTDSQICHGAIEWLDFDARHGTNLVLQQITAPNDLLKFIWIYFLCFIPISYIIMRRLDALKVCLFVGVSGLPFLPLYFVAIDWGRWLSFHFFSTVCIVIALELDGRWNEKNFQHRNHALWIGLIAICMGTPAHTFGFIDGGIVLKAIKSFSALFT